MEKIKTIHNLAELEKSIKKKIRLSSIQSALIATVAAAGILSVVALAPNIFQILKITGFDKKIRRRKQNAISRAKNSLLEKGLLCFVNTPSGKAIRLTKKGEVIYQKIEMENFQLKKPKYWDKKWRLLIFDVSEKKKFIRDELRRVLNRFGFLRIQDSSYLFPYKCDELVTLIKTNYKIGGSVIYLIVDEIENDKRYKEYFNI